jgi:hypothetical protein
MILGAPQFAGSFSYYSDGSRSNPVSYIFSSDISGDGVDEVFFVSFETQPNTPQNYSNTSIHIFGWKNNLFQELTSQWLPNSTNVVEGVGDVAFGDFNGDGLVDVFLSAYTDMVHPVNAYQLINRGTYLEKISLGLETWMHAVASADINHDGFDDVLAAGYSSFHQYLGSSDGLVKYEGMVGSSGLALGDFLGNGSVTAIYIDAGSGVLDTFLYGFEINAQNQIMGFNKIATLPGPRLEVLGLAGGSTSSHDIRARPVDFNGDGLLDVLLFSYLADYSQQLQQSEHKSEIQFLLNMGGGKFSDVTDQYRVDFDDTGYVGYYPQIEDVDMDGLPDVFVSSPDWMPSYNSTTLLLQQQNGIFLDTARTTFRTNMGSISGGQAIIVGGPDGNKFLVTEGEWNWADPLTKVYIQALQFPERNLNEALDGTATGDIIYGLGGNDFITGFGGSDVINGGDGVDIAVFRGVASSYTTTIALNLTTVLDKTTNRDGTDTVTNIERLQFSDTNVALDVGPTQTAGSVYMLYQATFNRKPDAVGLGYWIDAVDKGANLVTNVATFFVASNEFIAQYGSNPTNASYVDNLYQNVLHRAGEAGGVAYWNQELNAGRATKADVLEAFATLPEGASLVAADTAHGIAYTQWVG